MNQRKKSMTLRCLGLILMLVILGGCGNSDRLPLNAFEGTVLYQGKPATGAFVVFHPESPTGKMSKLRPAATVNAEGNFQLSTYGPKDGIPAGDYKVTVIWPATDGDESQPADRLMGRYSNFQTTPLQVTVDPANPQPVSFDLK